MRRMSTAQRATNVTPPPILLNKKDAAAAMGMSVRHFDRHVHAYVKVVYVGQLHLYPVEGLREWAMGEATIGGQTDAQRARRGGQA